MSVAVAAPPPMPAGHNESLASIDRTAPPRMYLPEDAHQVYLAALMEQITAMSIEDIDDMLSKGKSLDSETGLTDLELAHALFVEEAAGLLIYTKDHLKNEANEDLLDELLEMEETAQYDHLMALALSEDREPPSRPEPRNQRKNSPVEEEYAFLLQDNIIQAPPPPACVVCGDEIEDSVFSTSCGHYLDVSCLRSMFQNATTDETLFPPKCCQPLKLEDAEKYLDARLIEIYKKKCNEFSTPDRVYCHIPTCATFLGAATADPTSVACTSPSCSAETCGSCKVSAHPGRSCADHSDDVLLGMAQQHGWQRCYSCKHVVELTIGCYHMRCRCHKDFCYLCAEPWKTCECPLFDVPEAD